MTKRLHPVEKLRLDLNRSDNWNTVLARHVKPLLEALWADHEVCREGVRLGDPADCPTCRLLAEWRAKL